MYSIILVQKFFFILSKGVIFSFLFQVFNFMWKLYKTLGLHGKALKLAVKHHEEKQTKESDKIVSDIIAALGWEHVARYKYYLVAILIDYLIILFYLFRFLELGKPAKYPTDYQPF